MVRTRIEHPIHKFLGLQTVFKTAQQAQNDTIITHVSLSEVIKEIRLR